MNVFSFFVISIKFSTCLIMTFYDAFVFLRLRLIFSHCLVFHVDISVGQAGLMVSLMKYVYLINTALYQSLTLDDLAEGLITELLSSEVDCI